MYIIIFSEDKYDDDFEDDDSKKDSGTGEYMRQSHANTFI